jgi:PIN domain
LTPKLERKMSVDLPSDSPSEKKKRRVRKSQLRVVLDSNALYVTGSASDLVRQEITAVIADARYPDLEILWYLPEIVRHERQYQMQTEALKFRSAINKIERLLSLNLALTDQSLVDHVRTRIEEKERELGLQEIKLDHSLVDWPKLIQASAYRIAPFEVGEKEKGFRDALVAESFLQLHTASLKTPSLCRVVLVTSDGLLSQAVKERIADSPNASVLANLEELKVLP